MAHQDITKFTPAQQVLTVHAATIASSVTLEQVLEPNYWTHVAGTGRLRPTDEITCWWEDMTRRVRLVVLKVTRTSAVVVLESDLDLTQALSNSAMANEIANYDVSFAGPANKYRIIRKSDRTFVRDGFDTAEAAMRWLATDYLSMPRASVPAKAAEPSKKAA